MNRTAQITLAVVFLIAIVGVPVGQAIIDLRQEDSELQVAELFQRPPTEENLRAFESELEEGSYFEEIVRPYYQLARYELLRNMGEKALRGEDGWYFYHPGIRYLTERYYRDLVVDSYQGPINDSNEVAAAQANGDPVSAIEGFRQQLAARGINLLVIPIPGKASIYPERLTEDAQAGAGVAAHTRRFITELKRRGISVFDLESVFLDARDNHQLYLATDTHWTGIGVRLAAAAIAANVRKQPWYEAPERPQYRRETLRVRREGDIPLMTRIPEREALFGQETTTCYRVLDIEHREPYEDVDEASVLLLGDSFSRIYQTDAPQSAGLIANLAYELQQPLTSLVNDGGASTLVRQQLARYPELLEHKKLVIWAFVERDIRFGTRGWQPVAIDAQASLQ